MDALTRLALSGKTAPSDLRKWRGAFCIPGALPGIPYGDGQRIWTPAFGCYDDTWQGRILDAFNQRGYTHFVYNWLGFPYANDYPQLGTNVIRARKDMLRIQQAGLICVPCLFAAEYWSATAYFGDFVDACGDLVNLAFLMWECNEVLGVDQWHPDQNIWTGQVMPLVVKAKSALPHALIYIHFTPNHGSGGNEEALWWEHMTTGFAPNNVPPMALQGLLSQTDKFDDPVNTAADVQSTAIRLAGLPEAPGSWAKCRMDTVAFEQQTTALYHWGRTEAQGIAFNTQMLPGCPAITGWGDSGQMP